jgi:2-polyprenyl-3-methyl-5-hydroxy-6-metoxy-1,4-benzoquinol methylase
MQYSNLENAKNIIDIGPGYGFLLREVKKYFPHLNTYAIDPDVNSSKYLKEYNIKCISKIEDANVLEGFDLIISSHCLEHYSDPNIFFLECEKHLKQTGNVFLEVPNCKFERSCYLDREYDGPHLHFLH